VASNITLNSGSGGATLATEQNGVAEHYQKIKITDGTAAGFTNMAAVTAASALKVDASGVPVPVTDNGSNLHVQGAAASGATKAGNPLQTGAVFNTTQPTVTSGQAVEAQATARGGLIVSTGVDAFHVTVDSAPTTTVTGTVTANIGTTGGLALDATLTGGSLVGIVKTLAKGTTAAGNPTSTAQGANNQALDVNVYYGSALVDPRSIRALTSSDVVSAAQSGTWTVQPGNTANTTPWLVSQTPASTGGLSTQKYVLAATTNAQSVKASAGQVYSLQAFNNGSTPIYVKLYNKASAPTVGTDVPVKVIQVPANATAANGSGVVVTLGPGVAFGTGIALAVTGGITDADATATAANQGVVNLDYV
jgi:hypothetical protein